MEVENLDFDLVGAIMDFEEGALDDTDVILLFAYLIKTGMAWRLQGSYGRTAAALIDAEVISPDGEVNWDAIDE